MYNWKIKSMEVKILEEFTNPWLLNTFFQGSHRLDYIGFILQQPVKTLIDNPAVRKM